MEGAPVMGIADEQRVTRDAAIAGAGQLRNAPPEYLAVLPWRTNPDGEQWITRDDLNRWCGDGVFAQRAAAALQIAADTSWRDRRDR